MSSKRTQSMGSAVCAGCGYEAATVSVAFCPGCGSSFVPVRTVRRRRIGWFSLPSMLYPKAYKWFVFASAADIVLTWFIILLGGREVNVIADAVIATQGLVGIVMYKFCLVILVVLCCEVIGRRKPRIGHNLARLAFVLTAIPVILSIVQLVRPH